MLNILVGTFMALPVLFMAAASVIMECIAKHERYEAMKSQHLSADDEFRMSNERSMTVPETIN